MRSMRGAVRVDVDIGLHTAGGLRLENTVERRGGTLRQIRTWSNASVIGQHDVQSILVQHMNWQPIEQVAVLTKHVGFRSLADKGCGRKDQNVLKLFDRNMQSHALPRPQAPDDKRLTIVLIRS